MTINPLPFLLTLFSIPATSHSVTGNFDWTLRLFAFQRSAVGAYVGNYTARDGGKLSIAKIFEAGTLLLLLLLLETTTVLHDADSIYRDPVTAQREWRHGEMPSRPRGAPVLRGLI